MIKTLIKLSVLVMLANFIKQAKANSFFVSNAPDVTLKEVAKASPLLVYIKDLEYFNRQTTSAYTDKIKEILSFEPKIEVAIEPDLADYILIPQILQSKIEPIDEENSRYSMSLVIKLVKKDNTLVKKEQQNRYIIVKNADDMQKIAHKLLIKLLEDGLSALSYKINGLAE